MNAVKITNPLWLGQIAPKINDFAKKMSAPDITYETLLTYYQQVAQFGGDTSEFWIVFDGRTPQAFAHWFAQGLPHIGSAHMDAIYNWAKESEPVKLLMDQYYAFGVGHRCMIYEANLMNDRLFRVFRKYAKKYNIDMEKTERIHSIGRLKLEEQ